jgi:hypothetical protein
MLMLGLVHSAVMDGDVTWERSAPSVPSLGLVHQVPTSSTPDEPGRVEASSQCFDAVTPWPHADVPSTAVVQPWGPSSKSKT